ncbi:hypothetical protein [Streptomyces sp. NBC_01497]|uniref:hypothetical protein n=1 Tax=Streptomyces sp. NBC_01497 TaxID=2903885 RepID=UPI002E370EF6|nr:hypothetical protein [Streptomyces sp. NBC_01497]
MGKTSVAREVSALLRASGVPHAVIEGDCLCEVHPAPEGDPHRSLLTERNLSALWGNAAALGHRRLVYTNTVSVLEAEAAMFRRAMGDGVRLVRVLLTASDRTAGARLRGRERGSELAAEVANSARTARLLAARAPADAVRVATDGRSLGEIAREVLTATGWGAGPHPE